MKKNILLIVCCFKAKQSDEENYDNRDEDLSRSIIFTTQNEKLAIEKFKEIVRNEKLNSWVANYSTYNLPEYIILYEDKEEFYCSNIKTKEFTHIQIVHSPLIN